MGHCLLFKPEHASTVPLALTVLQMSKLLEGSHLSAKGNAESHLDLAAQYNQAVNGNSQNLLT